MGVGKGNFCLLLAAVKTDTSTVEISVEYLQKDGNSSIMWCSCTTTEQMPEELYFLLQQYLLTHVHCSSIHNSWRVEPAYTSINYRMGNKNMVHIHIEIPFNCNLQFNEWYWKILY